MRFRYNKKNYKFNEKNKTISETLKSINFSEKFFEMNSELTFKSFMEKFYEEEEKRVERTLLFFIEKGFFIVFKDNKFLFSYKIENKEIEEMLKSVFKISTEKGKDNGRGYFSNITNFFLLFIKGEILELFFVEADLKSRKENLYNCFKIKKKDGKSLREITAPNEEMKEILKKLNVIFQKIFDKKNSSFQIAYKLGKNIKNNADIHKNNKYLFNIDLKDFFISCKRELIEKKINFLFKNCPNREFVKNKFLDIILKDDALFIGSPLSGTLGNEVISAPVKYLNSICKKFDMGFSVYADDMSFSSRKFIKRKFIENIFNYAFQYYNLDKYFKINTKKIYARSKTNRRITGVSFNNKNETVINRNYYKNLRVLIHKLSFDEKITVGIDVLRGKINFALMIDESKKIFNLLKKFKSTIFKYNLLSKEKFNKLEKQMEGI